MNLPNIKSQTFFSALLLTLSLQPFPSKTFAATPFFFGGEQQEHIILNNRVLANINGKVISVADIAMKMDILFYREFPQYASSTGARFQFYQANWKHILQELIDKELILVDAVENKLPISSGEVRQEMETLFGPNIISSLDKIGITFEEAYAIVEGDLTLQKMLYIRVHTKSLRSATPLAVRNEYEEYAKANVAPDEWVYQVISIRGNNAVDAAEAANAAYRLLCDKHISLADVEKQLEKEIPGKLKIQTTVSEEYRHNAKEISAAYKQILDKMDVEEYSRPVAQRSRNSKQTVFRLFYLKEKIAGGAPPFAKVENLLKKKMLEKATAAETKAYLERLRKHYNIQESVQIDFQPFTLER